VALVVQKYGGSSVANADRIKNVAARIAQTRREGHRLVAVVSAMGDTTDELISLAQQISTEPNERELDLLLSTGEMISATLVTMALHELGEHAIALTGGQAGIRTDTQHRRARITGIDPDRMRRELDAGKVIIVAGFQGQTEGDDVTTLGRGASDLTAVALAATLEADRCEIYTDVDGIYTADPRVVRDAQKLTYISYEEMLELASRGAKMQPRSIELAEVYGVRLVILSSFNDRPGTIIGVGGDVEHYNRVRGVAAEGNVAKVTVVGVADRPGIAQAVFTPLAEAGINVDIIVQNVARDGITDMSFTLKHDDLARAQRVLEREKATLGAQAIVANGGLAKISIVGVGIQSHPGYAARMFQALARARINIEMITTSEIRITCLVAAERVGEAARAVHSEFGLDQAEVE